MQRLRHATLLARLVLAWFLLALGVAVAAPAVQPAGLQLVCAGAGLQLVPLDDGAAGAPTRALDCPLCSPAAGLPPAAVDLPLIAVAACIPAAGPWAGRAAQPGPRPTARGPPAALPA